MKTRHSEKRTSRSQASIGRTRAIATAIAHLQAPLRWVMILGERGGLSTEEIANLTGVSVEAVKSVHSRALALVQKEPHTRVSGCHA